MQWIHHYQLFLFDFDGLLVDTERLHFEAYRKMCRDRNLTLDWDFPRYCLAAHYAATGLRDQLYAELPDLHEQEPDFSVLYGEKRGNYLSSLQAEPVPLMPGVEPLLIALKQAEIPRVVVTHSGRELVDAIREKNPVLNTIPHWMTREDYDRPKPDSECYIKAIERFGNDVEKVVGFEDSPRGLTALLGSRAKPILICPEEHPGVEEFRKNPRVSYFPSFDAVG